MLYHGDKFGMHVGDIKHFPKSYLFTAGPTESLVKLNWSFLYANSILVYMIDEQL